MNTGIEKFDPLVADIAAFVGPMKEMVVESDVGADLATGACSHVKALLKKVEEVRDGLVRPANEYVKSVNARAKEVIAPLLEVETSIKWKLLAFARAEAERRRLEEERIARERAEAEAAAERERQAAVALAPDDQLLGEELARINVEAKAQAKEFRKEERELGRPAVKGMTLRWTFEVKNAEKIPVKFMTPNLVMIRQAIAAGVREIPGLRIYQEESVSVRAGAMPSTVHFEGNG